MIHWSFLGITRLKMVLCLPMFGSNRETFLTIIFCSNAESSGLNSDKECDWDDTLNDIAREEPEEFASMEEVTEEDKHKFLKPTFDSEGPNIDEEASLLSMSEDVDMIDLGAPTT